MPHPHTRRNKRYRPKHINVPVMPDLQREFSIAGHGALAALRLSPNPDAFDMLADIFNVIHVALNDTGRSSVILDSGMRAMQEVCNRAEKTGQLQIRRFELPPIANAMVECETLIKQLDVMRLHHARIKTVHLARLARILNQPKEAA
jgi:hypothetical protein